MRRAAGALALVVLLALVTPAFGLITAKMPLADFLETSTVIVTATVQELDPDRPSMVLKVDETLKGKAPFETMPVLLKGDAGAVKRKESPQLLKRLAVKLPVVVFAMKKKKEEYAAWVYTNGTWFGISGVQVDKEWRWSFVHLEPYLRRTYKGTTKEMTQTVRDALANKKKPPEPDDKEKPGLGPEVEKKTSADEDEQEEAPLLAVVPTVLVGGPLLMLAMLFPTAFGGWKRWLVLISTAGTNSTLYTLHWWFSDDLAGRWWGSPVVLWAVMGVFNVLGVVWAWQRHLALVQAGEAPGRPGRAEVIVLALLSVGGLAALLTFKLLEQKLLSEEWLPAVAFCLAMCIGCCYVVYARLRPPSMVPPVATEAVVLTGLVVVSLLLGTTLQRAGAARGLSSGEGHNSEEETQRVHSLLAGGLVGASSGRPLAALALAACALEPDHFRKGGERVEVAWRFRLPSKGAIASSPLVAGDRVYVAAAHHHPFTPHGAVYCLDRATGKPIWSFSNDQEMKPVFSSPVLADGRLYVGEGFHQDSACRVYCLDAASGKKLWDCETASHTESTPAVVDGRVFIGAGDDGVYCLDALKGTKLWSFPGFHVDAPPRVVAGRVYAGCGIGDEYKKTALLCLDAKDGRPVWRMDTQLPVWGRPVVSGGFVYAGAGNGRVNEAADQPAGEVLCLRERDGEVVWRKALADGVLASPVADRRHLYFGCRDGHVHALRRRDGAQAWRLDLGSPVVSTPAVEGSGEAPAGRLYAVASEGRLACVDSRTGRAVWTRELSAVTATSLEVISSPALEASRDGDGAEVWRLYVGVTLVSTARVGELICLEDRTSE
jgi:outer membrane protein assembly factor BamB